MFSLRSFVFRAFLYVIDCVLCIKDCWAVGCIFNWAGPSFPPPQVMYQHTYWLRRGVFFSERNSNDWFTVVYESLLIIWVNIFKKSCYPTRESALSCIYLYTNIKISKGTDPTNLGHLFISIQRPRLFQWRALNMFNVQ